jgi:hypothetical protein
MAWARRITQRGRMPRLLCLNVAAYALKAASLQECDHICGGLALEFRASTAAMATTRHARLLRPFVPAPTRNKFTVRNRNHRGIITLRHPAFRKVFHFGVEERALAKRFPCMMSSLVHLELDTIIAGLLELLRSLHASLRGGHIVELCQHKKYWSARGRNRTIYPGASALFGSHVEPHR